jgi:hypothetical protein
MKSYLMHIIINTKGFELAIRYELGRIAAE